LVGVFALAGAIQGCARALTDYRKMRAIADIDDFMDAGGPGRVEVAEKAVYRSGTGSRQYRRTKVDAIAPRSPTPIHFHLEFLGPDRRTTTESSLVPIRWPMPRKATRVLGARSYARVAGGAGEQKVRFFLGKPPELTGGQDRRQPLPLPEVIILDPRDEGVFLWRFGVGGTYAGDTWHPNVEEAVQQATYEFGDRLGEWVTIGPGAPSVVAHALKRIS